MKAVFLQATIGGMAQSSADGGESVCGIFEPASGVLLIDRVHRVVSGEPELRMPGHAVVTNNPHTDDRDEIFTDEHIRGALLDYMSMSGRGLLSFDNAVGRVNPSAKIEPDGVDERGRKFRVAADITNGQMAVIAMCWYAIRTLAHESQLSALEELVGDADDYEILSVGMDDVGELRVGRDGWPVG